MKKDLNNKKLAGIDYGRKRVGTAVCDQFHITTNPRKTYIRDSVSFWEDLTEDLKWENVDAIVVGVPYRDDDKNKKFIDEIFDFINELKQKTGLAVYSHDEYYTSKKAVEIMLEIGKKKKKRSTKGEKDKIAAALILRSFLDENDC